MFRFHEGRNDVAVLIQSMLIQHPLVCEPKLAVFSKGRRDAGSIRKCLTLCLLQRKITPYCSREDWFGELVLDDDGISSWAWMGGEHVVA